MYSREIKTVKIGRCYMLCLYVYLYLTYKECVSCWVNLAGQSWVSVPISESTDISPGSGTRAWLSPALTLESSQAMGHHPFRPASTSSELILKYQCLPSKHLHKPTAWLQLEKSGETPLLLDWSLISWSKVDRGVKIYSFYLFNHSPSSETFRGTQSAG